MPQVRIQAVQCGASNVACGLLCGDPGQLVLEQFATRPVDASRGGEDDWLAAVGDALRELLRGEERRGPCVIGLPGHLTFNRPCRVPAVSARQRRKVMAFEQRPGTVAAEELVWSHAVLGRDQGGQDFMLAVAKRRLVEELGLRVREQGLFPEAALPAWLVLRHAAGYCAGGSAGAVVLSVGTRSSHLVSVGSNGVSASTFAVGGSTVTEKLADELALDYAAAEALKLQGFAGGPDRPARELAAGQSAIDEFGRRLADEILSAPPFRSPANPAGRPAVLWLTGGGARLPELPAALAERLQLRVERWALRSRLGVGGAAQGPGWGPDDVPLVDLVGLAAYATGRGRAEGNLLPRPFRREMFVRRRWPWLAAGALIVVLAGLGPIWRLRAAARESGRENAALESALAVSRRAEARDRSLLARLAEANRRTAALRRLARGRSGWATLLGSLQERLAGEQDVWLDRLQVLAPEPRGASGEGAVASARAEPNPPTGPAGPREAEAGIRILVTGRLLEAGRLAADGGGDEPSPKFTSLLGALRASPLVAAVEHAQATSAQPGILNFALTLRLAEDALF